MSGATAPPSYYNVVEKGKIRYAAVLATKHYPGPVGEMIYRELNTWDEFGFRFGGTSLILKLIDHLYKKEASANGG